MSAPKFAVFAVVGLALGGCVASPDAPGPGPGPVSGPGPREGAGTVVGAGTGALLGAAVAGGGAGNRLRWRGDWWRSRRLDRQSYRRVAGRRRQAARLCGANGRPRARPAWSPGFLAKPQFGALWHHCSGCRLPAGRPQVSCLYPHHLY